MRKPYKKAYLEITNVCNLSCNFCPKTKREAHFVSLSEFSNLIKQIKFMTNYVYFHLMGEPLLHPLLGEFLKICEKEELHVSITTNGTRLAACHDLLIAAPSLYKISISLHSFEANESEQTLEDYVSSVLRFVKDCECTNAICVLRLWNKDSAILKASNQRNIDVLALLEEAYPQAESLCSQLEKSKNIKLAPRIFLETAEKFSWPDITRTDPVDSVFCYGLRDQFGVLCDGTVVPCCLDSEGSIPLGNAFEVPLSEILSCERARALYDGFSNRQAVESLCKRCGYANKFNQRFKVFSGGSSPH